MKNLESLFDVITLSIVLFFVYQLIALISNICARRKQRSNAFEESERKVLEQYRNKYLSALEKNASKKEMENIDEDKFKKYIQAVRTLCELPEKKDEEA